MAPCNFLDLDAEQGGTDTNSDVPNTDNEYNISEIQRLNDDKSWPTPKWLDKEQKSSSYSIFRKRVGHSYNDYFLSHLRARYSELVVEFRTLYPTYIGDKTKMLNVFPTSKIIFGFLTSARIALERENPGRHDLMAISDILDSVNQCIVWIYPENIARIKCHDLCQRLKELNAAKMNTLIKELNDEKLSSEKLYPIMEECTRICDNKVLEEQINTGLQIERLSALRFWGVALLFIFIIGYPMVTDIGNYWPNYNNTTVLGSTALNGIIDTFENRSVTATIGNTSGINTSLGNGVNVIQRPWIPTVISWTIALSVAMIGAIGGFLSGLLQVRKSKTSLALYEESVLLFQLRPMVGAFAALVSIMLLSWGVLSGVVIQTPGSWALVAFGSGFSERYFLKLLNIEPEEEQPTSRTQPSTTNDNSSDAGNSEGSRA